jgi:hypothetical protein
MNRLLVRDQGVGGSNPLSPTKTFTINSLTFSLGAELLASSMVYQAAIYLESKCYGSRLIPWARSKGSRVILSAQWDRKSRHMTQLKANLGESGGFKTHFIWTQPLLKAKAATLGEYAAAPDPFPFAVSIPHPRAAA